MLPPFGVDTAAVYRAWDELAGPTGARVRGTGNDLEAAALEVEPRLATTGGGARGGDRPAARLAGSGSTWFVEGEPVDLGIAGAAVRSGAGALHWS